MKITRRQLRELLFEAAQVDDSTARPDVLLALGFSGALSAAYALSPDMRIRLNGVADAAVAKGQDIAEAMSEYASQQAADFAPILDELEAAASKITLKTLVDPLDITGKVSSLFNQE